MKKKVLCLALAFCMLLSMLPTSGAAMAHEGKLQTGGSGNEPALSLMNAKSDVEIKLNRVSENHYKVNTETTEATVVQTYCLNGDMVYEIDDSCVVVTGAAGSEVYSITLKADESEFGAFAYTPTVTLTAAETSVDGEKEGGKPVKTVQLTATRTNVESYASKISYTLYDSSRTSENAEPVESGEITIPAGQNSATKDVKYTYAEGSKEANSEAVAGLAYVEYAPVENCSLAVDEKTGATIRSTAVLMKYVQKSSAMIAQLKNKISDYTNDSIVYENDNPYDLYTYVEIEGGKTEELSFKIDVTDIKANTEYDAVKFYYKFWTWDQTSDVIQCTIKLKDGNTVLFSETLPVVNDEEGMGCFTDYALPPMTRAIPLNSLTSSDNKLTVSFRTSTKAFKNIDISLQLCNKSDFDAVIPANTKYKPGDIVPIMVRSTSKWFSHYIDEFMGTTTEYKNSFSVCITPAGSSSGTVCTNVLATLGESAVVFGYQIPDDFTGGNLILSDLKTVNRGGGIAPVDVVSSDKAEQDRVLTVNCVVDNVNKLTSIDIDKAATTFEGSSSVLKLPVSAVATATEWMYTDFDTEAEEPYIKSMYATQGNGSTKLPLYIRLDEAKENIEYLYVKTDSIPDGEMAPLHFFYLPEINDNGTDYTKNEESLREAVKDDARYLITIITGQPVEFDTDADDETKPAKGLIEISYNDSWAYYADEANVPVASRTNVIKKIRADYYTHHIKTNDPETTFGALTLSYETKERNNKGEKYTYAKANNFSWTSSDETIATIEGKEADGKMTGVVTLTGKTGEVTFSLTCSNGKHPVTIESKSLTVSDSTDPYIYVPATSETVTIRQNMAVTIGFTSNLSQMNAIKADQMSTTYTMKVYSGEDTGGTPVYTTSETSTASVQVAEEKKTALISKSVSALSIPENELTAAGTYTAVIYADFAGTADDIGYASGCEPIEEGYRFKATAKIVVKSLPVTLTMTRSTESAYVLDSAYPTVNWTMTNATAETKWNYVISKSDGTPIKTNEGTGKADGSYTFTQKTPAGCLKEIYTVTVYATNDEEKDGWTVASTTLYLYNGDALDILIRGNGQNNVTGTNDNAVLDNYTLVSGWLNQNDGKTLDLAANKLSIAELQKLLSLSAVVSLNTEGYEWGNVSDQIEWTAEHDPEDSGIYYYHQATQYVNLDTLELPSVFPTAEFVEQGLGDGKVSITATHVRTGLSTEAELSINTLQDKLYLFQFNPRVQTTVDYWDTLNEKHSVKSDATGQLAILEENGIAENSIIYLRSEKEGVEYLGTIEANTLRSGEVNSIRNELYPVKVARLSKTGQVELTFVQPNGAVYASKNITVRGGVYCNGEYAVLADLFPMGSTEANLGAPNSSNGLNDLTFTTDSKGKIGIKFNMMQICPDGDMTGKQFRYVFELRCEDGGYRPVVIRVDGSDPKATVKLTAATEPEAFFNSATLYRYDADGNLRTDALPENGQSVKIGPNGQFTKAAVEYETVLWQHTDLVESDGADLTSTLLENSITQYFCGEKSNGNPVRLGNGDSTQTGKVWIYPFSTMPLVTTTIQLDADGFGVNADGSSNGKATWLAQGESVGTEVYLQENGQPNVKLSFAYRFYNGIGTLAPMNSYQVMSNIALLLKDLNSDMENTSAADCIPNGTYGASALKNAANQSSSVSCLIFPVFGYGLDATQYNVCISVLTPNSEECKVNYPNLYKSIPIPAVSSEGKYFNVDASRSGDAYIGNLTSYGIHGSYAEESAVSAVYKSQKLSAGKQLETRISDFLRAKTGESCQGALLAAAAYDAKEKCWKLTYKDGELDLMQKKDEFSASSAMNSHLTTSITAYPYRCVTYRIGKLTTSGSGSCTVLQRDIRRGATVKSFVDVKDPESIDTIYNDYGQGNLYARQLRALAQVSGNPAAFSEVTSTQKYVSINAGYTVTRIGGESTMTEALKNSFKAFFTNKAVTTTTPHPLVSIQYSSAAQSSTPGCSLQAYEGVKLQSNTEPEMFSLMSAGEASLAGSSENSVFRNYSLASITDTAPSRFAVSADAKKVFFLDEAVASWATIDGDARGSLIEVSEPLYEQNEKADFGHSELCVSGSGTDLFAAWVTQTQVSFNDNGLAENAALVEANSSEVTVAAYDSGTSTWVATMTDNGYADKKPAIDSMGSKAVLAWFTGKTSGADMNTINYDVDANIMFRFYNGSAWGGSYSAFNTVTVGSVQDIDVAMLDENTAVIACTVLTKSAGTEIYYSIVHADGTSETTRATDNATTDKAVQVIAVGENTDRRAVLAWYTVEDDAKNIRLLSVAASGARDGSLPETVANGDIAAMDESFRIIGSTYTDLTVVWTEDGSELKAVRLFRNGETLGVSSPITILTADETISYSAFDLAMEGEQLTVVLEENDYSKGRVKKNVTSVESLLACNTYENDEAYEADLAAMKELYPDGIVTEYPVADRRIEKQVITLTDTLTVADVVYNSELVAVDFEMPVYITVRNDGFHTINGLALNSGLIGAQSNKVVQITLLPGESTTLQDTIIFDAIKDYEYMITADGLDPAFGMLRFNIPEISIDSMTVTSAGGGKRGLQLCLSNPNEELPLSGNDKTVSLALYADSNYEMQVGETKSFESEDFVKIDNGVMTVDTEIDLAEILEMRGATATDFLTGGIELYALASVQDAEETINSASLDVRLTALFDEPFGVQATTWEQSENSVTATASITNISLESETGKYIRFAAYNDRNLPIFYYYEQADFDVEETKAFTFTVPLPERTELTDVLIEVVDAPEYPTELKINNATLKDWFLDTELKEKIEENEFDGVMLAYAQWSSSVVIVSPSESTSVRLIPYADGVRMQDMTEKAIKALVSASEITIDLTSTQYSSQALYLSATLMARIADCGADGMRIKMKDGSEIFFDTPALKAVSAQAQSEYIRLSFVSGNAASQKLNEAQRKTVKDFGDPLVLDVGFRSGCEIGDFKGGYAELTVAYSGAESIRVWFVDADGAKTEIPADYDGANVCFKVSHFSTYVIETAKAEDEQNAFEDVLKANYFYEPVLWAVEHKITTGQDSTHFAPYSVCTRAQMVTFLWRSMGSPAPTSSVNPFTDTDETKYYADAVLWAVENGITNGVTENSFAPNATVTRAQAVTFLYRCLKAEEPEEQELPFTDVPETKYYRKAVLWAYDREITTGTSSTAFSPNDVCTRAQIVTFLYRAMNK